MTGSADLSRLREAEIEALRKRIQEVEKDNSNTLEELDLVDAENHTLYKKIEKLEKENEQLKKTIYDLQSNIKKNRT